MKINAETVVESSDVRLNSPPRALILAGGFGTRLRSVVNDRPKPLAPIHDKPFLEYQIELLQSRGIVDIILCVGYQHEQIQDHFRAGDNWNVNLQYSIETRPLGTAGAIKHAAHFIDGTFLVMNGDTYASLDVARLIGRHRENNTENRLALGTLALVRTEDGNGCGTVRVDGDGRIVAFDEKQQSSAASCLVNAGVYVFEPELLDWIPSDTKASLEYDVFPRMIANDQTLLGHFSNGFLIDIGTPAGYDRFRMFMERSVRC